MSTWEATRETLWLSDSISQPIQDVLGKFYGLADSKSADAGPRMAAEVFSEDAVMLAPHGTFRGSAEIAKSRENAWKVVTKRCHRVVRVFAGNQGSQATPELALFGTLEQELANGKALSAGFASLIRLVWPSGQAEPRISYLEIFADTAPIAAALKASP